MQSFFFIFQPTVFVYHSVECSRWISRQMTKWMFPILRYNNRVIQWCSKIIKIKKVITINWISKNCETSFEWKRNLFRELQCLWTYRSIKQKLMYWSSCRYWISELAWRKVFKIQINEKIEIQIDFLGWSLVIYPIIIE